MTARPPSSPYVSVAARPDTREGILTRRTFRTFERRPVPPPLRVSVLEAARSAPSVADADFVRYIVIDDPALKKQLFGLTRPAVPDLLATMETLRAATRFTEAPVPAEHVFEVLRAGQWAPSAGNFQPVRFVVLRDRARLAELDALARESVAISAHWFPRYLDRGEGQGPRRMPALVGPGRGDAARLRRRDARAQPPPARAACLPGHLREPLAPRRLTLTAR